EGSGSPQNEVCDPHLFPLARSSRHVAPSSLANVPPLSSGRIRKPRASQQAMTEPVVPHHGERKDGAGGDEARPSASTAYCAALHHDFAIELANVCPKEPLSEIGWHGDTL